MQLSDQQALMERTRAVLQRCGGMEAAADVLGIQTATLRNRFTPTNESHQLGLFQFLILLDHAFDAGQDVAQALELIARRYRLLLVHMPGAHLDGDALHAQMSRIAQEVGDVATKLITFTAPSSEGGRRLTAEEFPVLDNEINQAQAALENLRELARATVTKKAIPFRPRGA
jgi:hypothetical protein